MGLQELQSAVQQKVTALRAAESAADWRQFQGRQAGAERVDFDDSGWEQTNLPITWSGAAGDIWLRRTFRFPETLEGISTTGSQVELPFVVPIHSRVFVDGVERVAEPSWLDTRVVPLVLTESYQPGQEIQVTLHASQGDGFGLFLLGHAEVSAIEQQVFQLELLGSQMTFTHYLAFERANDTNWQRAWQEADARLDLEALEASRWDAWWQSVEAARALLAPMAEEAKTFTTHLVGHSHIDMNWLWTWDETVDVIRRDFAAADTLMERYPAFRFSQSQASTYRAMQQYNPEILERVKQRVAEGRWEVTANTWVEGDLNMANGESLVRHFMLTRSYVDELFGVQPRICWEPDTFGHCATLPQLLKQVGIDFYYFCRAGRGKPIFWWEGLDGSRVLAFNDFYGYGGIVNAQAVTAPVLELARRHGLSSGLWIYGVGDHGGGATARDIENALRLDETPLLPHAQMSDLTSFYQGVQDSGAELPVVRGELNTTFEGCYTSHGDIKMLNRRAENALLTAEVLGGMARTLAGASYPAEAIDEAWQTTLFHQFHDILDGCAIGATYKDAAVTMQPALDTAESTIGDALAALSAQVNTGEGAQARVVVWNPTAWTRSDVVRLPLADLPAAPTALVDDRGVVLPAQVVGDTLLFVARELPSLGCRVYQPTDAVAVSDLAAEDDGTLRNGLLEFHVHPASGAIDSLRDIENDYQVDTASNWRGVERKQNAGMINRLQIHWEEPHPMSAWNIGDITRVDSLLTGAQVRVEERGPVRATIVVERDVLHSRIRQRYCLYTGLRRIDIETEVDWHEHGGKDVDAPMLRALFKPNLGESKATFEVPYAGLERNATGDEVPALRWADISDGAYGLALLNDGKYGHAAHGTSLGLTLVRSSYEPDNLPDQGLQSFTYALYPHAGDWRQAHTDRHAVELNQPLLAAATDGHAGSFQPGNAILSCDAPGILVTAVKPAASGENALVVRLVEMQGAPATAQLRWSLPVQRVEQVDILERHLNDVPLAGGGCSVTLLHHEVATLKLSLA